MLNSAADTHAVAAPAPAPRLEQLAYAHTIQEAAALSRICRASLYAAIKRGELIARKRGRSTLVLREDLEAFLKNLPRMHNNDNAAAPPISAAA
jgi:excisionase family DNA binding protein